ncbi:MAG: hypothetical protein HYY06_21945 [Deltaproteobacteria bacterium]|nr:hypothetical protein [Deltaproteobacteria bacterium]
MQAHRKPLVLVALAALLGAVFAYVSTADFALHLDRQVHPLHCSLVPGAEAVEEDAAAGCRAAMVSPYSSFFRRTMWGGIPVSLLALGTFAFLLAFSATLIIAPPRETRRPAGFLALASLVPLVTSIVYLVLALGSVGQLCKVCVGIYISSALLAGGVVWLLVRMKKGGSEGGFTPPERPIGPGVTAGGPAGGAQPHPRSKGRPLGPELRAAGWWVAWAVELALVVAVPVLVYRSSLPDYGRAIASCGGLTRTEDPRGILVPLGTAHPRRDATFVIDPLCPACRDFHRRLEDMGDLEKLDARMLLFPLDSSCNWMLDRPLHPGACVMSRAVLCAGDAARDVLEWGFENQEELTALARRDEAALVREVTQEFPRVEGCIGERRTERRLETGLQWAVDNHLPVLTPQLYIEGRRLCDEDTDLGLEYAMKRMLAASGPRR